MEGTFVLVMDFEAPSWMVMSTVENTAATYGLFFVGSLSFPSL